MHNKRSALPGIMITSGSAIGAGMFSIPIISSGMWFPLSITCLVIIWYLSYLSAIYVLEVNFHFPQGASFDTMVKGLLGNTWNIVTGISIAFLLYILLYAYFSAFGNIASHSFGIEVIKESQWLQGIVSLALGGLLAAIVWASTAAVGRISTILVTGMIIAYFASMFGLGIQIESAKLFDTGGGQKNYLSYLWVALPYYMTSFGIASVVPSLYKFYGKDPVTIKKGLLYGSLLALLVYIIFVMVSFGNISREAFIPINEAGGNMGNLVNALEGGNDNSLINFALNLFSNFAIITSFLAVGLSLFDFIADKFKFGNDMKGRFYTACITFIPAGIASFFFPHGFIAAIGFAGLVVIFGFFVVPYLMVSKIRASDATSHFNVYGGKPLLLSFLLLSLVVAACHILAMLDYLPTW